MTPKVPTSEQLARLRAVYGERAPARAADFASAAASARCTIGQARLAWFGGWPAANIPPLEVELGSTRERETAAAVAVATAEQVAGEAIARAAALDEQVRRLVPIAGKLVDALEADGALATMPAPLALGALHRVVGVLAATARIDSEAVELKQLVDGKAQRITMHVEAPSAPLDAGAARERAEFVLRALKRQEVKQLAAPTTNTNEMEKHDDGEGPDTIH